MRPQDVIWTTNFVCFYSHALDGNGTSSCKNGALDIWRLAPMLQEHLSCRVRCQLHQLHHTLRAMLSMHGRRELLHTVVHSVCRTGTTGRAAPPLGRSWWAAAPNLTSLVPPRHMTLQVHSPRMTLSRLHLLRLVLTVLQMHLRTRRTTYADGLGLGGGEDQESARSGTGGVDTPHSVDFSYLNYFCMILFSF
jgi:hypothetical protein